MIPFAHSRGGGAAAVAVVTAFDPAFNGAGVVLSNNNLTARGPATPNNSTTRTTSSRISGKYSARLAATGASALSFGAINASGLATERLGVNANGISFTLEDTEFGVYTNGSYTSLTAVNDGTPIDLVVDLSGNVVFAVCGGYTSPNYTLQPGRLYLAGNFFRDTYIGTLDIGTSRYAGTQAWG